MGSLILSGRQASKKQHAEWNGRGGWWWKGGESWGPSLRAGFVTRRLSLLLSFHCATRTVSGSLSVTVGEMLEGAVWPGRCRCFSPTLSVFFWEAPPTVVEEYARPSGLPHKVLRRGWL